MSPDDWAGSSRRALAKSFHPAKTHAVEKEALRQRLERCAGHLTFRAIAELTGHHPETVRRYMRGQRPSVPFVVRLCRQLDISPHWLLTGEGEMKRNESPERVIAEMTTPELFEAIASTIDSVIAKIESMDARLAALEAASRPPESPAS